MCMKLFVYIEIEGENEHFICTLLNMCVHTL